MSRNIKFKAWNIEQQIMHDIAFPSWNGSIEVWENNKPQSAIQRLSMHGEEDEGILLEFSGIKDKKGVGIYEGDVIDIFKLDKDWNVTKVTTPVIFEECSFIVKSESGEYDTFLGCYEGDPEKSHPKFKLEVIGNVFQEEFKHMKGE